MSAVLGSLLVMLGSLGFSVSICGEYRKRIRLLKKIRGIYEYIRFQIAYGKMPIPEMMKKLSCKEELCFQKEFGRIAKRMEEGNRDFALIWKEELGEVLRESGLKPQEQEWLLQFPARQGFLKEEAQADAFLEVQKELEETIAELERVQKNRNKMIMSVGATGGVLLSILFL